MTEEEELIIAPLLLGPEDIEFVVDYLENPPEPNDALREAAEDYLEMIRSGRLKVL